MEEALRATVRRFVEQELRPHVNDWEEAGTFPRALYQQAGELGLLALGFPEAEGGIPASYRQLQVLNEELCRTGCGGLLASLFSHRIGAPPIVHGGSVELRASMLPGIFAGEKISALAVTEPGGGSDVASLATTAVRDGEHYIVNGSKTFITSGMRADWITVAVRTGGAGASGISALLVPGDTPGLARSPLKKNGLVVLRYRRTAFRPVPRAGREPAGRGERRLCAPDAQLQRRTPDAGHACLLPGASLP